MASSADSGVKATTLCGCGMLARASRALVVTLSPQASATAAVLTVGTPKAFRMRSAYRPLVELMLRSSTASIANHGACFERNFGRAFGAGYGIHGFLLMVW